VRVVAVRAHRGDRHRGMAHHAAPSQIEAWAAHVNLRLRSHPVWIQDGIDRLRTFLRDPGSGEPRITISPRCQVLVRGFANYPYHEPREHRPISELPMDSDKHVSEGAGLPTV